MKIYNLNSVIPEQKQNKTLKTSVNPSELSSALKIPPTVACAPDKNQITALKPALRDPNRVNVFLNEKFAFSLDLAQVVDYKLKIGTTLTPAQISELESASEFGKLYNSTLEWVLIRPRSEKETRDHLRLRLKKRELENKKRQNNAKKLKSDPDFRQKAKDPDLHLAIKPLPLFSETDIEEVISQLKFKKYLDDHKFAEFYIENRNLKKGISRRQLSQELLQKGIGRDVIDELLQNSPRSETEEIRKIIQKKSRNKTPDQLLRYLVSKGFSYDLSKTCIAESLDSADSSASPDFL